jgi:hypothetical protein
MTITIKYFGITYSIETKEDNLNATEMLETFTNLMKCAGWQQSSIDGAIMELNEQIDL